MKEGTKKFIYWSPRILCILLIIFISLFALDVFNEGYNIWQTMLALFMHLIPSFVLLIVLIISWRWEWIGGILFLLLAVFYIYWTGGRMHYSAYLLISGLLFIISILFFLNWKYGPQLKKK